MSVELSVVVPAYNCERYVGECLSSILAECTTEVEIIVVNDGSTDNTLEVCRGFEGPLVQVHDQSNMGVSNARNVGVALARGKFVMFVDADDVLAPGWSESVFRELRGGEDVVVFSGTAEQERYSTKDLIESIVGIRVNEQLKWISSPISRIYNREFLRQIHLRFDTRVLNGEDALWNIEAFVHTKRVLFVQESIYRYRVHPTSATRTYDSAFTRSNEYYLASLENLLMQSGLFVPSQVTEIVDFSFCTSVELMVIRIARIWARKDRKWAASALRSDVVVRSRMRRGIRRRSNWLRQRVIYLLVRIRLVQSAVTLVRLGLRLWNNPTKERWVAL